MENRPVPAGIPLAKLAAPIFAENLVRTSLIAIDQLMLYAFSVEAAAAMSAASQLAFFLQLLYLMPSQGAGILVAQRLGARKREEAESYAWAGIVMVLSFSVLVSIGYIFFSGSALGLFALAPGVRIGAVTFLSIYGGASLFMALNIAQAVILRSWGYTRDVMVANISALCCTIAGNYLALFGPFGLPESGGAGRGIGDELLQRERLGGHRRRRGGRGGRGGDGSGGGSRGARNRGAAPGRPEGRHCEGSGGRRDSGISHN